MTRRVRALATPAVAAGLRLAGIPAASLPAGVEPREPLLALADDPDVAVLLVEAPVLDAVPEVDRRALERRAAPILVSFPAPAWEDARAGAESFVLELLRRAIGYRVRLQ